MTRNKIFNEEGVLTEEAMEKFASSGTGVACECPAHLVDLLKSVKEFTEYQDKCITEKPSDKQIHNWLKATSVNLELLLSSAIVNLARMEGVIDNDNNFTES